MVRLGLIVVGLYVKQKWMKVCLQFYFTIVESIIACSG